MTDTLTDTTTTLDGTDSATGPLGATPSATTGVRDEHYDLISVLYHCLVETDTVERYIADARDKGGLELAEFFTGVRDTNLERIARCKELLAARIEPIMDTTPAT